MFWLLGRFTSPLELYALYLWTGLLGSLAVLQFWMVLGELYTVTQAKRLYSLVWTGSLLGATAGAGAARLLAQSAPASSLVLASAVVFAVTAVGPAIALGRAAPGRSRSRDDLSLGEGARLLQSDPYVRSLAVLVLVSTVALTLGDYVFKSSVARSIPKEQLGSFFGGFYALLNLLALIAQATLGSWLFRAIGLHRALWMLPVLLFCGAAGTALGGGLAAALLLKGADGSLRNSLHRTGSELLYMPLPDGVRARAKPLIDLVGQRGGQALASLLILSESFLARGDVVLAAACAAVSLVWIAWVADLKELYLEVFRAALRQGTLRPAADLPPVDLVSLETLFAALNSSDDNEVVAAMDLLAGEGRARLIPALILYHPSQRVVLRGLEIVADEGRTDFLPIADRLQQRGDPEIRSAALRARVRVAPDEAPLRAAAADPSPLVQATAARGAAGRRLGRRRQRAAARGPAARRRQRDRRRARPGHRASSRRPPLTTSCCASPTRPRTRCWCPPRGRWGRCPVRVSCPRCWRCSTAARCAPRLARRCRPSASRGSRSWAMRSGIAPCRSSCDATCRARSPSSRRATRQQCSSATCSRRRRARSATASCGR